MATSLRSIFRVHRSRSALHPVAVAANLFVFAGAIAFAAFVGFVEADPNATISQKLKAGMHERFWRLKARGRGKANLLILGDSRACLDVSPDHLIEGLPGDRWKAMNLGFNAGGLTPLIFELADRRLDRATGQPVILLGITPPSLTSLNAENSHYRSLMTEARFTSWAYLCLPRLMGLFSRKPLPELVERYPGQQEYHDNGWLAAIRDDDQKSAAYLPHFRNFYADYKVRAHSVDALMDQTALWTQQGVRVVGFRPPVSPEMIEIEDSLSGYDETAIRRQFESRGGHWIEIDPTRYRSFDNSHLSRDEALKLSRELGRRISRVLAETAEGNEPPPPEI